MSSAAPPLPMSTSQRQDYYFYGAWSDYLLAGGFSIGFYFLVSMFMNTRDFTVTFLYLSGVLAWVVNWPHFAATNLRLYANRDAVRQYPLTATLIPVVIFGGMLAALLWPHTVAPYFVKLFLIWSPYHFSGQTVGVTLIYARRAGFTFSSAERTALSCFVFGTFLYTTALAESHLGTETYYDIQVPTFGIPSWVPQLVAPVMWGGFSFFLWGFVRQCYAQKKIFPIIILVPSIAQWFWFIQGSRTPGFYEFVPFFHSLQYLLVASSMRMVEQAERSQRRSSVLRSMVGWTMGILLLGMGMFWLFPRVLELTMGVPLYLALGVSAAAVQIHHFFVDGVIWKLKRKTVSHPLMLNAQRVFRSLPSS